MNHFITHPAMKMDLNNIEIQLALYCAPVITGLKVSNLLILKTGYLPSFKGIMDKSKLSYYMLRETDCRTILLLYNECLLKTYLKQEEIMVFLKDRGYRLLDLNDILSFFKRRYEVYHTGKGEFPHELGLILGYPLEDVEGFVKYRGKYSLYTGYWKVYGHLPLKRHLFSEYDSAKDRVIKLLEDGLTMSEIMNGFGVWYPVDQVK